MTRYDVTNDLGSRLPTERCQQHNTPTQESVTERLNTKITNITKTNKNTDFSRPPLQLLHITRKPENSKRKR